VGAGLRARRSAAIKERMAYDEALATRIRALLADRTDVEEKRMFGGIKFIVAGAMACGIGGDELVARVGPQSHLEALSMPRARPMDFTGRPLRGLVYVAPAGLRTEATLRHWVEASVAFALSVRRKKAAPSPRRKSRTR
jgi:TfoX/Sxy family transcriptional regulator of competence genes